MLHVPLKGLARVTHNMGAIGSVTPGASVTTGAAATTKGTPVELLSAAQVPFDAYWVTVYAMGYGASGGRSEAALDILGGAATEEVLIPNLLAGGTGTWDTGFMKSWDFPLYVPAGTRLAAQAAGQRLSTAMRVGIILRGGPGYPPWRVGTRVTTYGVTVPGGTAVVGGSGAEGAWTQIIAATTSDHFAIVPSLQLGNDTTVSARALQMDVGIGAATEEMIGESWWTTSTNEAICGPTPEDCIFQDIPSGTRLSSRISASGVPDTYEVALHCVS